MVGVGKDSGTVGVGKGSGMVGVGKDSGMVYEWISSHFMAWHVEFQPRISYLAWNCDVNVKIVKCKH